MLRLDALHVADKIPGCCWKSAWRPTTEAEAVSSRVGCMDSRHGKSLPGEYDDNFHLSAAGGELAVLCSR